MDHFYFNKTPLIKLDYFSEELGCNILMKRDDLFEYGGGGSKARMLMYILYHAISYNYDYIVTAGGPYSNFNRAISLLCKLYKLPLTIVLYDKNKHINRESLNKRILDFCNIDIIECDPDDVVRTIEDTLLSLKLKRHNPFYIWGGGKSNQGVKAYEDAFFEIKDQLTYIPDEIFTALGTGTTFSGIIAGNRKSGNCSVINGISVAREKKHIVEVVNNILEDYSETALDNKKEKIYDEYLLGGYGVFNKNINKFISKTLNLEGLITDHIYVGKALYGMYNIIKQNQKHYKNKTIVFINTGGIYNF